MEEHKPIGSDDCVPPGTSVLAKVIRSQCAELLSKVVNEAAYREQASPGMAAHVRAFLLHKLLHWIYRKGTHIFAAPTLKKLERLGERLALRELRRLVKESGAVAQPKLRAPIRLRDLVKLWCQLTFEEQRVLRLTKLEFSREEVAMILGIPVNAVEFYLNQANRKIHETYCALS